jgi:cytochrome c-type biogenesis protein CcmH/NrfG
MFFNKWVTLVLGLMIGLVVGYALAELQPVPPARALIKGMNTGQSQAGGMPPGHPPVPSGNQANSPNPGFAQEVQDLEGLVAKDPTNYDALRQLGNLYYDHSQWPEAQVWYERARKIKGNDPDLLTDLAVVYRNQHEASKALELLNHALKIDPSHWRALYNKVVVLHFDLHRRQEAMAALAQLEALKKTDTSIPDLSTLEKDVAGK